MKRHKILTSNKVLRPQNPYEPIQRTGHMCDVSRDDIKLLDRGNPFIAAIVFALTLLVVYATKKAEEKLAVEPFRVILHLPDRTGRPD